MLTASTRNKQMPHAQGKSCFPGPTRRQLLSKRPSEPKLEIRYRKTIAFHGTVKGRH